MKTPSRGFLQEEDMDPPLQAPLDLLLKATVPALSKHKLLEPRVVDRGIYLGQGRSPSVPS
jgi:hypothetical protein